MKFADITKIMNDIAGFVKSFIAQLKGFIEGFKHDYEWSTPTGEDDHRENKD